MKVVRVPWIRCRADEEDISIIRVQWRGQEFTIMAHSQREAEEWWVSLRSEERDEVVGIAPEEREQASFW